MVESVYCAVRTDSLYKADYVSSLKGQSLQNIIFLGKESSVAKRGVNFTGFPENLFLKARCVLNYRVTLILSNTVLSGC